MKQYTVTGMSCAACQARVEKAVAKVPGVCAVSVSLLTNAMGVEGDVPAEDVIVLIHDGVRPLIDEKLITDNIESVKKNGNAITVVPAIETIIETDEKGDIAKVADRKMCRLARAPQSFVLSDIIAAHERSLAEKKEEMIDSAMLMQHYGAVLHTVEGPVENIKITTPMDYHLFKALVNGKNTSFIEEE